MDADKIIKKGDIVKFLVEIDHEGYDMQQDDFYILLQYGLMGGTQYFDRENMLLDDGGLYYLIFSSAEMTGPLLAEVHYEVPDSDMETGTSSYVERHWLGFVTDSPCPRLCCGGDCGCQVNTHVKFTREYDDHIISDYLVLRTNQKEPIRTEDGAVVRVTRAQAQYYDLNNTGDEVQARLDQVFPNRDAIEVVQAELEEKVEATASWDDSSYDDTPDSEE